MRHVVAERAGGVRVGAEAAAHSRACCSPTAPSRRRSPAAGRPDGALAGSPASAGTVTGRARVVLDPVGAHLEPGEILVAPSTDPGWTPLFLTAGGLVMEMGGVNSHGAVVAREYGIPAVVGVPDATQLIETGQLVTVDGAAGLVTVQPMVAAGSVAEAVTGRPTSASDGAAAASAPGRFGAFWFETRRSGSKPHFGRSVRTASGDAVSL